MGLIPSLVSRVLLEKNRQKQVKKKAFFKNAKIEDVGLNEDKKKYGNKKWSLNFHDKTKSLNLTYCFSVVHKIKIKQYHT